MRFGVVQGERGPQARDVQPARGGGRPAPSSSGGARAAHGSSGGARSARPRSDAPVRGGEGVVARYDAERGFGFITPDAGGPDLFVHVSVLGGGDALHEGERVRFSVRQSDRGPQADRVERLS